jgi:hypothetical protein
MFINFIVICIENRFLTHFLTNFFIVKTTSSSVSCEKEVSFSVKYYVFFEKLIILLFFMKITIF